MERTTGREPARAGYPDLNGLASQVAAVEAARERLGADLDRLTAEVRGHVGTTVEKTVWKMAATGLAIVAGVAARKLIVAGWRKARHSEPPTNPADPKTQWGEAVAWSVASGVAVGLARLFAARGAAQGWRKAMGTLPPGLEEVSP